MGNSVEQCEEASMSAGNVGDWLIEMCLRILTSVLTTLTCSVLPDEECLSSGDATI